MLRELRSTPIERVSLLCLTLLKKVLLIEHLFATRCAESVGALVYSAGKICIIPPMETKWFNFPENVPLVQLENGAVRVRNSRVTLETIVIRSQMGDTVARIHSGYPTVSTSQIEDILAWYHANKADVDEYLREVEVEGEKLRQWIESQPGYKERHEKLLRCREELRRRKAQLSKA